jgi:hypothetical protein
MNMDPHKSKWFHINYHVTYVAISSTYLEEFIGDDRQTSSVLLDTAQFLTLQHGVKNLQEQLQRVLVQEVNLSKRNHSLK